MKDLYTTVAVVPAAGTGKRMGASINKQYLELAGKPIVARTLEVFQQSGSIDAIVLVTPEQEIPYCRENVVEAWGISKVAAIVPGGRERQNSVMNALSYLEGRMHDDGIVLIHDGVRPFISGRLLQESIAAAAGHGASIVAVPAKDTIKVVSSGLVDHTPDRSAIWQAQTPQAFRFSNILAAHRKAESDGFLGTDDSSLIERSGGRVAVVQGSYRNIKITTPEDLVLAEAFLADGAGD